MRLIPDISNFFHNRIIGQEIFPLKSAKIFDKICLMTKQRGSFVGTFRINCQKIPLTSDTIKIFHCRRSQWSWLISGWVDYILKNNILYSHSSLSFHRGSTFRRLIALFPVDHWPSCAWKLLWLLGTMFEMPNTAALPKSCLLFSATFWQCHTQKWWWWQRRRIQWQRKWKDIENRSQVLENPTVSLQISG